MHTNWHMTWFLFFGLIGAALLFYEALKIKDTEKEERQVSLLFAAGAGILAVCAVALKLNSLTNLINILAKPSTGFSSAVISQIVAAVFALAVFYKKPKVKTASVLAAVVFVYEIFCLFRLYKIATRQALNTVVLFLFFAALSAFAGAVFKSFQSHSVNRQVFAVTAALAAILMAVFVIRLGLIEPPDRVIGLSMLMYGNLAPVFWGMVITFIAAVLTQVMLTPKYIYLPYISAACALLSIFLLSVIVNQLPALSRAVEGRMLF